MKRLTTAIKLVPFALLALMLFGCSRKAMIPSDPAVSFYGPHSLLILVPGDSSSRIIDCDYQTGAVVKEYSCPLSGVRAIEYGGTRFLIEARTFTPDGSATIQPFIFDPKSGNARELLPPDESLRKDFSLTPQGYVFLCSRTYSGASGGMPWTHYEVDLMKSSGQISVIRKPSLDVLNLFPVTAGTVKIPLVLGNAAKFQLSLLNIKTGKAAVLPLPGDAAFTSMSPDSAKTALLTESGDGSAQELKIIDNSNGSVLEDVPVSGRVIQLGYGEDGSLYFSTTQYRSGVIQFHQVKAGKAQLLRSIDLLKRL